MEIEKKSTKTAVYILQSLDYSKLKSVCGKSSGHYGKMEMETVTGTKMTVSGFWKRDKSAFVVDAAELISNRIKMTKKSFNFKFAELSSYKEATRNNAFPLSVTKDRAFLKTVNQATWRQIKLNRGEMVFIATAKTHMCILRNNDYAVFEREVEAKKKHNKAVLLVLSEDETIRIIRGFQTSYQEAVNRWFITNVKNVGDISDIFKTKVSIKTCKLTGQYGSAINPLALNLKDNFGGVTKLFENKQVESVRLPRQVAQNNKVQKIPQPKEKINLSTEIPADCSIYLFSQKCHCSKCIDLYGNNTMINCTATVQTIRGGIVPVSVMFCTGCGTFFMNYDTYSAYSRKYGGLKFQCHVDKGGLQLKSDLGFAKDSFLSRAGYSVNANMPRPRRQGILANLMDDGKATKWEITEKISEFIRLGKKNPNMQDAIKRWEEDIAFVADYDADRQTKVGRATFKQGGKITQR